MSEENPVYPFTAIDRAFERVATYMRRDDQVSRNLAGSVEEIFQSQALQ